MAYALYSFSPVFIFPHDINIIFLNFIFKDCPLKIHFSLPTFPFVSPNIIKSRSIIIRTILFLQIRSNLISCYSKILKLRIVLKLKATMINPVFSQTHYGIIHITCALNMMLSHRQSSCLPREELKVVCEGTGRRTFSRFPYHCMNIENCYHHYGFYVYS